jgi:hypothetical protein
LGIVHVSARRISPNFLFADDPSSIHMRESRVGKPLQVLF